MVQLLLTINLILIVMLFLLLVGEFVILKRLDEKIDELEANIIKIDSKASNNELEIDKIREQISFLKNQIKLIPPNIRR